MNKRRHWPFPDVKAPEQPVPCDAPKRKPMQEHVVRRSSREVADHMRRFFRASHAHLIGDRND